MEGLNRAAGAPVPFEWQGKKYVLDRFTIGDWAYLEEVFLKRKRRAIVKQATDLKGVLDDGEYREMLAAKIKEAGAITEVSNEEIAEFISGGGGGSGGPTNGPTGMGDVRGMVFFMATILDKRYPGEFTEGSILELISSGAMTEQHLAEFALSVQQLRGNSGNSTSRTGEAVAAEQGRHRRGRRRNRQR